MAESPTISDKEWILYMDVVANWAKLLGAVPVAEMLQHIGTMEALAPTLEPTAYRDGGGDNLRDQAELLRAVLEVQEAMSRIVTRKLGARRIT